MTRRRRRLVACGFTLVELLLALAAMALLGLMAWRGIDGMAQAQATTRRYSADVLALQAALAQWGTDLDAVSPMAGLTPIDFDGRVLRMTRLVRHGNAPSAGATDAAGGLQVVAWGVRSDAAGGRSWLRWQSPLLRDRREWALAWEQAAVWGQTPTDELRAREIPVALVDDWQVFYFRNNSWTSPLSSAAGGAQSVAAQAQLPDGVRLVLNLSPGQAISGRLERDWVRPTLGPGGS